MTMPDTILDVQGLRVDFVDRQQSVTALRDVSFTLERGKTLALVGESGSGKSVTSLAIMGLLPQSAQVLPKKMHFHPSSTSDPLILNELNVPQWRALRGSKMSMIFQEPMSSLNPLFSIGDQINEMLLLHTDLNTIARKKRVIDMLNLVEIPSAAQRYDAWPHELSGGMRQRVMIAMALVCHPALLIADEPTTALDVTIQAQILDLMRRLQAELNMSILFITHDLGVVAEMADEVAVMYAGQIVEQADVQTLFKQPLHPYTQGLLNSIPRIGLNNAKRLTPIPGNVPSLKSMPSGCSFEPRCRYAQTSCQQNTIPLTQNTPLHWTRCLRSHEVLNHAE